MRKRLWVMLLSIVMVVTFMPQMAFAAGASKTAAATSAVTITSMDQLRTAIEKGKGTRMSFRLGADIAGSFSVKGLAHKDSSGKFIRDEDGEKIVDTTTVTLDLNEHNIKGSQVNSDGALLQRPTIVVGAHGKLTITGNGTVTSLTDYEIIENYGYCTISGGTYKNPETTLIWNRGIMTINKGTFESLSRDYAIFCAPNDEDTALTINGGTFTAQCLMRHYNYSDDDETVLIKGGDFAEAERLVYLYNEGRYSPVWSVIVKGGTFSKGCKTDIDGIKKARKEHEEPMDDAELEKYIQATAAKMKKAVNDNWNAYDAACQESLQEMLEDYTEELEEYDKVTDIDDTLRYFMNSMGNVPTKAKKAAMMQQLRDKAAAAEYDPTALEELLSSYQSEMDETRYMDEEDEEDLLRGFESALQKLPTKGDKESAKASLKKAYDAIKGLTEDDQDVVDEIYADYLGYINAADTHEEVMDYADAMDDMADTLATKAEKDAALARIRAAYSALNEEDYSAEIWEEIEARAEEDDESYYPLDELMTKDELAAWTDIYVNGAKDVVKAGKESALEDAKAAARQALKAEVAKLDSDDYSEDNWEKIQSLLEEFDVDGAISLSEVQAILDYQKSQIQAVEKDMEAVRKAQSDAIDEIKAKLAELEASGKYSDRALEDLRYEAKDCIDEIEESESLDSVDYQIQRFNETIANTLTKEQEQKEEEEWQMYLLEEAVDDLLYEIKNLPANPTLAERARVMRAQYDYNKLSDLGKKMLSEKDPNAVSKLQSSVKTVDAQKKAKDNPVTAKKKVTRPAKVKITKLVKGKKKMTVKFKKVKGAKGYQVCYSLKKNFKKGKKITKIKKVKKYSKKGVKIKKLKSKKTYYVKVRAYKVAGGKTIYGKWSKVKKVKIK